MNQMELDKKHQTEWVDFEILKSEAFQLNIDQHCLEVIERHLRNAQEKERFLLRLGLSSSDTHKLRCLLKKYASSENTSVRAQ